MGKPKEPEPVKLFISLMAMKRDVFDQGVKDLRSAFGQTDTVSETFPFDFTDYYTAEMGKPLFRHFITFERLIPMPILPDIKHATNRLEEKYMVLDGKRQMNIDPGYLCLEHVILATTKGYTHRPYLRDGIYADLELVYRDKSFQPLQWTYPDYRQEGIIKLFNLFRREYLEDLRGGKHHLC
jgi:uncharacterized protein DUF4416